LGQVTRKIQKDAERGALDRILAALALTPDSEPEVGGSPDFIIQLRGQSIGVEITLYSSGEIIDGTVNRRAGKSGWDLLKAAAQEFWSQRDDLRAVNVGVTFKGRVPRRRDYRAFIEEVAAFVRQHSGELQLKNKNFFPSASSPLMHRYLAQLVLRTDSHAEWYSNFSSGWVARPNDSKIPDTVKNKSKKKFRPTNELWLVIDRGPHISEMTLELDGVEVVFVERDRAVIVQVIKFLLPFLVGDLVANFVNLQHVRADALKRRWMMRHPSIGCNETHQKTQADQEGACDHPDPTFDN
jgi:hypothetical protein